MRRHNKAAIQHLFCLLGLAVLLYGFLPLTASSAELSGAGIYLARGGHDGEWESSDETGEWSFDTTTEHYGIGFLLDVSARPFLFKHQRLRLGYEKIKSTVDGCTNECRLQADRFVIDHTLKLEINEQSDTVFWLGPELRVSRASGSPDGSPELDITLMGFGVGAEMGVDIALDHDLTLGFQAGYMRSWYIGKGKGSAYSAKYEVDESSPFFGVSIIFAL